MFYVYRFRNKINNKVYIGKTKNPKKRFVEHKRWHKNSQKEISVIKNAIKKYGIESFDFVVLEEYNTDKEANEGEKYYISYYKSNINRYGREYGYNLTDGGEGISGFTHSEETKKQMSEDRSGDKHPLFGKKGIAHPKFGKPVSQTTRDKMSKAGKGKPSKLKGRKLSEETKTKMSLCKMGDKNPCFGKVGHRKGKPMSEETKQKLSAAKKGKYVGEKNPNYGKSYSAITREKISIKNRGEGRPNAKLTNQKVIEIKQMIKEGKRVKDIAAIYGVNSRTISGIKTGVRWKHIK